MSSKAVKDARDEEQLTPGWQALEETAPSLLRPDEPRLARITAFVGLLLLTVGAAALLASAMNWRARVGPGWGVIFFVTGVGALLFHASGEKDLQYRRTYGTLGFGLVLAGAIFSLAPVRDQVGAMFLPYGFCSFGLGLLFLISFARNETEEAWHDAAVKVVGVVGAVLALVGFVGGNVDAGFLAARGLPLAILGLGYCWAYVGLQGANSPRGYWAGFAIGAVGLTVFVIALGRSLLPPLLYSWDWLSEPPAPFLVPSGLLLMATGLLYLVVAVGVCADNDTVVLTRRELASFFYSPMAYIVIFGMAVIGWWRYLRFANTILLLSDPSFPVPVDRDPLIEPVVSSYILDLFPVIAVIFIVPVLTMRLLSEEKRTGTLEVLLTAPLNETTVVVSKFLAGFMTFLLVWLPWFLYLVALRVEGGREFDYRPLLSFFIALACTGAHFIAMGLFFSSLTRNQIAAAILTFMGMMVWTAVFFVTALVQNNPALTTVLNYVSYIDLWFQSMNGFIAPRYLVFHLSATVFWLFLATRVLEARKWA